MSSSFSHALFLIWQLFLLNSTMVPVIQLLLDPPLLWPALCMELNPAVDGCSSDCEYTQWVGVTLTPTNPMIMNFTRFTSTAMVDAAKSGNYTPARLLSAHHHSLSLVVEYCLKQLPSLWVSLNQFSYMLYLKIVEYNHMHRIIHVVVVIYTNDQICKHNCYYTVRLF